MELFDRDSVLSNQQDQIRQLEAKLKKETEKLKALEEMFATGVMNEKLLFSSTSCTLKKPYQYLPGLLSEDEAQQARDHFAAASTDQMNADLEYTQLNVNSYAHLPKLEAKLEKLFPNMKIFGTHWFQGKKDGAEYSGWHTGINLQKCFKGKPLLITCWIPLQDLTSETGGQLWYYNGPHQTELIESIRHAGKQNMLMQYCLLQNYDAHLEQYKVTENVKAGDCFVFREIMPHSVDTNSHGLREIISIRLVEKSAEIDDEFFAELDSSLEKNKFTFLESDGSIKTLKDFCSQVKEATLAAEHKRTVIK